ncbi:MAG: hypothetical protein HS111_03255 [Kofleriaceae bacterium]|nr:hypothetical protein [Kofleriaceae bacterium]
MTANFKRTDKTLTVTVSGTGTGTWTSVPAGINAPTDGSETYAHGTSVTLTASPTAATSDFDGWTSGPCMGSTNPICAVTMVRPAPSTPRPGSRPTPHLNKLGAGTGTVTSTPAGLNYGTACHAERHVHPRPVGRLSPRRRRRLRVRGLGGACSGGTCSVTMTQDRTVTANSSAPTSP